MSDQHLEDVRSKISEKTVKTCDFDFYSDGALYSMQVLFTDGSALKIEADGGGSLCVNHKN